MRKKNTYFWNRTSKNPLRIVPVVQLVPYHIRARRGLGSVLCTRLICWCQHRYGWVLNVASILFHTEIVFEATIVHIDCADGPNTAIDALHRHFLVLILISVRRRFCFIAQRYKTRTKGFEKRKNSYMQIWLRRPSSFHFTLSGQMDAITWESSSRSSIIR